MHLKCTDAYLVILYKIVFQVFMDVHSVLQDIEAEFFLIFKIEPFKRLKLFLVEFGLFFTPL